MLELLIILVLLVINAGISAYNAWVVGKSWAGVKATGSAWQKIVLYSAFVMSGCGFTWCYLIVFAFAAVFLGFLDIDTIQAVMNLGYAVIILPILGSGLAIWIDSVITAYRRRNLVSVGTAAWNTFAMANNAYSAATTLPQILKSLAKFFKGGNSKSKGQLLVILLVILALSLGFITTYVIVRKSASEYSSRAIRDMGGYPA